MAVTATAERIDEATSVDVSGYVFDSVDTLKAAVEDYASGLDVSERIKLGKRLGSIGDAIRTAAAAELVGGDGDTRAAQRALGGRKTSKRKARREAKRAGAAAKNPKIAKKMAAGGLSGEQVDALIEADRKTDGAATADDDLIDDLASASADATSKIVDDYVKDSADDDSVQAEHDRQRKLRNARKHPGRYGLGAITIEGDEPSIDQMWKQLRADASGLFQRDGGRDVPPGKHPRTNVQRLFDAAWARLTGGAAPVEAVDDDGRPVESDGDAAGAEGGAAKSPIKSRRHTPPAARRPTIVIGVSLDRLIAGDPSLCAEQIGVGPIADSVLAGYLANTELGVDLVGALFGGDGQPLWLSRTVRFATDPQFLALVVRDKGCTLCDAGYDVCQAHHLTPWNAPAKGETDIDKLALLCDDCHHRLHDANHTLYRDPRSGEWKTRPATDAETPPARPPPSTGSGGP